MPFSVAYAVDVWTKGDSPIFAADRAFHSALVAAVIASSAGVP